MSQRRSSAVAVDGGLTCARKSNFRWPNWGQNVRAPRPASSQTSFTNHFIGRVHRARRRGWQWFTEGWPEFEISAESASAGIDYLRWIIIKKSGCKLIGGTALGRYGELCVGPRAARTGRLGSRKRVAMRTSCSFVRRGPRLLLLWCLWNSELPGKKNINFNLFGCGTKEYRLESIQ